MNRKLEEVCSIAATIVVIAVLLAGTIWWTGQKWQACGRLYDNQAARLICVTSSS